MAVCGRFFEDDWSEEEDECGSMSEAESRSYSDAIGSDIEAELYSNIHHSNCSNGSLDNTYSGQNNEANPPCIGEDDSLNLDHCDQERQSHMWTNDSIVTNSSKVSSSKASPKEVKSHNYVKQKFGSSSGSKNQYGAVKEVTGSSSSSGVPVYNVESSDDDDVCVIDSLGASDSDLVTNVNVGNGVSEENGVPSKKRKRGERSITSTSTSDSSAEYLNLWDNQLDLSAVTADSTSSCNSSDEAVASTSNCTSSDDEGRGEWYVDEVDVMNKKMRKTLRRRYYASIARACRSCGGRGHVAGDCPEPRPLKCYLCGGSHTSLHCNKKVCGCCYSSGHSKDRCMYRLNNYFCTLCKIKGHKASRCPDIWRKFHFNTTEVLVRATPTRDYIKQHYVMYCYNCGAKGHFGPQCSNQSHHWEGIPSSFVTDYRNSSKRTTPQSNCSEHKQKKQKWRKKKKFPTKLSSQRKDFSRTPKRESEKESTPKNWFRAKRFKKFKMENAEYRT